MKKLIEFQTGTGCFPVLKVGTYDGQPMDTDRIFDSYNIDQDFEEGYIKFNSEQFFDHFSFKKFKTKMMEVAQEIINDEVLPNLKDLKLGIIGLKVSGLNSPKYYNFSTDQLDLDLKVTEGFYERLVKRVAKCDQVALAKFLKDNFTSYDGFMSWTANNIEEMTEEIAKGRIQEVSAFLTFLVLDRFEDWQYIFEERMREECQMISDFLDDEFYAEIAALEAEEEKQREADKLQLKFDFKD